MKQGFPIELLSPDQSAICFFCAAFGGENDVKYLHEAGMKDVFLIDIDREKIKEVSYKYGYDFIGRDAFEVIDSGFFSQVDLIICDQWTNMDEQVNETYFDKFKSLAKKFLIIGISQKYIDSLKEKPPGEYYKRSDHEGGVYWRVIKI